MDKTKLSQKILLFLEQKTKNQRLPRLKYFLYAVGIAILGGIIVNAITSVMGGTVLVNMVMSIIVGLLGLYLITLRCNDAGMSPLVYIYIRGASLVLGFLMSLLLWLGIPGVMVIGGTILGLLSFVDLIVGLVILFTPSHEFTFFTMWKGMQGESNTTTPTTTA